jgi:O-Antigen ligase.
MLLNYTICVIEVKNDKLVSLFTGVLLVVLGGLAFHAPLMVFMSSRFPDYSLIFKSWKEILLAIEGILAVWLVIKYKMTKGLLKDRLFVLAVAYCSFGLVVGVISFKELDRFAAGMLIDFRYVVMFILMMIATKLRPSMKGVVLRVTLVVAAVVMMFGVLQVTILPKDVLTGIGYSEETILPYMTIDENPDFVRINSTLRGPNVLGAYGIVVFLIVLASLATSWKRENKKLLVGMGLFLLASLACVWFSYSRAAILGLALGGFVLVLMSVWSDKKWRKRFFIGVTCVVIVGLGTLLLARDTDFVRNVVFHDNVEVSHVSSNAEHWGSLKSGVRLLGANPLGLGIGSSGSASQYGGKMVVVENQFLFVAHELGWVGLVMFVVILVLIFLRLLRNRDAISMAVLAGGVGLVVIGMVLPVFADETVSMTWFGLAGTYCCIESVTRARLKK